MDWNAWIAVVFPSVARLSTIVFATLGVVYMAGRLLFPSIGDRGKNVIAFVAILAFSFLTVTVYDYGSDVSAFTHAGAYKAVLDWMVYATVSTVFYVVIGWRFYSRADAFLDQRFGKDKRSRK